MTVVFMRDEAVGEHALFLDHTDPAPEATGSRHDVVTQLVAVADHGQMDGQILERVVSGVGHQVVDIALRGLQAIHGNNHITSG